MNSNNFGWVLIGANIGIMAVNVIYGSYSGLVFNLVGLVCGIIVVSWSRKKEA